MTLKAMLAATAMMAALAGCEQIQTITEEPSRAATAEPQFFENAYAAQDAGKFSVPAIPEDQIPPAYRRQIVPYDTAEAPGTIIIDPAHAVLYLVQPEGKAIRYGISVGREGFGWSGVSTVDRRAQWPTWTPPAEMIDRQPSLEKWRNGQPGGPTNPLGARALYLYIDGRDYGFRIHGTPEWRTIGKRASSGCFRMIQQDVIDLYNRVPNGTKVVVLTPSGEIPTKLTLPPPSPTPKRAAPKPVETTTLAPTAEDLAADTAAALEQTPPADDVAPTEGPETDAPPEAAPTDTATDTAADAETEAPEAEAAPETGAGTDTEATGAEESSDTGAAPVFTNPLR